MGRLRNCQRIPSSAQLAVVKLWGLGRDGGGCLFHRIGSDRIHRGIVSNWEHESSCTEPPFGPFGLGTICLAGHIRTVSLRSLGSRYLVGRLEKLAPWKTRAMYGYSTRVGFYHGGRRSSLPMRRHEGPRSPTFNGRPPPGGHWASTRHCRPCFP